MALSMSHSAFASASEGLIRKLGLHESPRTMQVSRIDHLCSTHPHLIDRAFEPLRLGDAAKALGVKEAFFVEHNQRIRLCNFTGERGEIYTGAAFNLNAEGPPNTAHGGGIATLIDTVLALLATHNTDRVCLTKELRVFYEKPLPLGKLVLVRAWIGARTKNGIEAVCDIVDEDLMIHARGTATFVMFPIPAENQKSKAVMLSNDVIEKALVKARLEVEREEDARGQVKPQLTSPIALPPLAHEAIAKRYAGWRPVSFAIEFPDLFDEENHSMIGFHQGRNFDFSEKHGTTLFRRYEEVNGKGMEALVYFSPLAEGPPKIVHGGAIASAADNFLADSTVFRVGFGRLTKSLSVRYLRPIPIGSVCLFQNLQITAEARSITCVRASLTDLDGKPYCLVMAEFALLAKSMDIPIQAIVRECGRESTKSTEEKQETFLQLMIGGSEKLGLRTKQVQQMDAGSNAPASHL